MEQLIYEIAGIKYLLVERQVTEQNRSKLEKIGEQYNCIWQGIKEIKQGGFLSDGFAIVRILVPENNVIAFNSIKY